MKRDKQQSFNHDRQIETVVKPIFKLSKVAWHMILPNCMKSTRQTVFDIAQHSVDPFKTRALGALSPSTGHDRAVLTARLSHTNETYEHIGEDVTASHQAGLGVASDFALTDPHTIQLNLYGAASLRRLKNHYGRDHVGRAAFAFTGFSPPR